METPKNDTRDRELKLTRTIDAPVELVWEVWTKPEHIVNWWGPNGFTNTMEIMNLAEGGEWKFVMHGPDGTNYPNRATFTEIIPLKKIAYEHFNPHFMTTVTFEAQGDKTVLTWQMVFDSVEQFTAIAKAHGVAEGLKQNIEKLNVYLKNMNR